jgi:colanic acid/amylovoran biosynthesis protein
MHGTVSPANSKLRKLFLAFAMMAYTLLYVVVVRSCHVALPLPRAWREPMQLLTDADMQVCVGGGYLRAKSDPVSTVVLLLLLHQIWLAKVLGKPVYLYAQSFGPYPKAIQRKIAAFGLRRADLILVREAKSKALLADLGLAGESVVQVPDSAFLFRPRARLDVRQLLGVKRPDEQVVGITVRSWLPASKQDAYERAMAEFIERTSRCAGLSVAVIAQVTSTQHDDDDRVVGRRIQELLGPRSNVVFLDQQLTHHEVKSLFANLSYLVGTRFHSVIFALTEGVPALAIEYEHKTMGIMQDLGLEKWVVPIEDVTADKLAVLFDRLVRDREAYIKKLQGILPIYVAKASEASRIIEWAYRALMEERHRVKREARSSRFR